MRLEQNYNSPLLPIKESSMSGYPNILTPPSSNEDSPQPPVYFVASPNSSSFHAPENYNSPPGAAIYNVIPQTHIMINPTNIVLEPQLRASLHFIEQPTDRFRFRYKSEMAGTHGSLTGFNSDKSRKQTYPTVELRNYNVGTAIIRCSIYQMNAQDKDFMPHAHRLIMKKGKEEQDDPHDLVVGPEEGWRATFHGMGIIHTAKKNILSELIRKKTQLKKEYIARNENRIRELTTKEAMEIKGLAENEFKSINLNIVCLRFDAFIKQNDILFPICEPIYSHGINNLKSAQTGELKIVRIDHCSSPAKGGKEIFALVERVTKKNIKIRFFELDDEDQEVWSDFGKFNDLDVHHQYAIVFKTPKFRDENITHPVKVFMELVRPSDQARSEPRDFTYYPSSKPGSKRPRTEYSSSSYNSSNMDSDELPAVITNFNQLATTTNIMEQNVTTNVTTSMLPNNNNSWNEMNLLTSEELRTAITQVDSDEFRRLFDLYGNDYVNCLPNNCPSIGTDAPYGGIRRKAGMSEMPRSQGPEMHEVVRVQRRQTFQGAVLYSKGAIKLEVSPEDKKMACTVYEQLKSFVKTTHTPQRAIDILNHYLGADKTNALHVFVALNNVEAAVFFIRFIGFYKQYDLINLKNVDGQTPLHLAVRCRNELLVSYLLKCKAKVKISDDKMNTALHCAIEENVPVEIMEFLLADRDNEKVKEYIDETNCDGNSALVIAVENKNIIAVKLLCRKGSDVNQKHGKNGFTPLRFAIEKQYLDVIKYLLSLPLLDPTILDFKGFSPLAAANHRESSREITEVIQKYMERNNLTLNIKEEEESDEEMDDDSDVKSEVMLTEDLEEMYQKVTSFTSQCLDEVAEILNESGKWQDLAELLDISTFLRCGMISSESNVSKNLLKYAIETNGDTLWEIRNFLENLDETKAVGIMDRMVHNSQ